MHTGAPDPQSMTPVVHGFPVAQAAPGVHTLHSPAASHSRPSSQLVPAGSTPTTLQVATPSAQTMVPCSHGLPVSQSAPSMQIAPSGRSASVDAAGARQKMLPSIPGGHCCVWHPRTGEMPMATIAPM
jgi:hypothetical protein